MVTDNEFQEVMKESLDDVLQQIDILIQHPHKNPHTFAILGRIDEVPAQRNQKIWFAITNYYLGMLEGNIQIKLVKKFNFNFTSDNKAKYNKNFISFFNIFKKKIGTIKDPILDIIANHNVHNLEQ